MMKKASFLFCPVHAHLGTVITITVKESLPHVHRPQQICFICLVSYTTRPVYQQYRSYRAQCGIVKGAVNVEITQKIIVSSLIKSSLLLEIQRCDIVFLPASS